MMTVARRNPRTRTKRTRTDPAQEEIAMVFEKSIPDIEAALGYTFRDKALLRQAFTRESYCNEVPHAVSNEILEFCGDSVLGAAIVTILAEKYGKRDSKSGLITAFGEGGFSIIKSNLTNKTMLGEQMRKVGLAAYMRIGTGDRVKKIWEEPSVREDLFESIIGAIWFDCGQDMAEVIRVLRPLLDVDEYLRKAKAPTAPSPKNAVQEWCDSRAHAGASFTYTKVDERGPDHDKHYTVECRITTKTGEVFVGRGEGRSTKRAEIEAAKDVLRLLGE